MISWAIRYQPILKELYSRKPASVLEVGSGAEGLAMFWRGRVIGIDLAFKRRPLHYAVQASALALPFSDRSWPIVVSCDMLEHVHPSLRRGAVKEIARVCEQLLLLAFPSGAAAQVCYAKLAQRHTPLGASWLTEHIELGLPDAAEVATWLQAEGWSVQISWHEAVTAHQRLMSLEIRRPIQMLTYTIMRIAGPLLALHWPVVSHAPQLRAILRAERASVNVRSSS
jgi:SAM-dependent methyltransferase